MHVHLFGCKGVGCRQDAEARHRPVARGISNRRAHQVGGGVVVQVNQGIGRGRARHTGQGRCGAAVVGHGGCACHGGIEHAGDDRCVHGEVGGHDLRGRHAAAAGGRVGHFGGVGPAGVGGVAVQVGDVPGLAHHAGVADFGAVGIHLYDLVGAQGGVDRARDQSARAGVCGEPVVVVAHQGAAVLGHGAEGHRLGDDVANHKVNGVGHGQAARVGAGDGDRGGARRGGRATEGAGGSVEGDARWQRRCAVSGRLAVGGAVHVGKVARNAEAADGGADQQACFVGLWHHQGGRVVGAFDGDHQVGRFGAGAVIGGVGEHL